MANHTVLIIDYEPRSIRALSAPLERAGFDVQVAHDGIAGLSAFEKLKPALVLIEAMLPKKHGFEVCAEIKKSAHGKGIPVFITTGVYRGRKYRTQALHIYGCDEYLVKPFTEEQLLEACRRFLGDAFDSLAQTSEPSSGSDAQAAANEPEVAQIAQQATGTDGRPAQPVLTAVEDDLAEQEISARLEAILPGHPNRSQEKASTAAAEASPSVDPPEKPRPFESSAGPSADLERSIEPLRAAAEPRASAPPTGQPAPREAEPPQAKVQTENRKRRQDRRKKERGGARRRRREVRTRAAQSSDPAPRTTDADEPSAPQEIMSAEQMFAELAAEMEAELPASTFEPSSRRKEPSEPTGYGSSAADYQTPECVEALAEPYEPAEATALDKPEEAPHRPAAVAVDVPFDDENKTRSRRGLWIVVAAVLVVAMGATLLFVVRGRRASADPAAARRTDPVDSSRVVEASTASVAPSFAALAQSLEPGAKPLETRIAITDAMEQPPAQDSKPTASAKIAEPQNEPAGVGADKAAAAVSQRHTDKDPVPGAETVLKQAAPPAEPEPEVLAPAVVAPPEIVERQQPEDLDDPVGPTTERDSPVESEGPEPVEAIEPEGAELVEAAEDEVLPIEPPPPTTARGDLVNLHDADRAPTTLNRTPPDYPMTSRRMKHAGTVVLNVLVDENGAVDEVEIIRGVSNELNEAAARAVKSWTYEPAEKDGVAVKVWKPEKVAFKL